MAPSTSTIDCSEDLLRLIIDYGTGELKVAAQFIRGGHPNRNPDPFTIQIKGQLSTEQKIILEGDLDDGHLIWGERDVNLWRRYNPRQSGRVCQLWKLVLSEDYRDSPSGQAVFKAIGAEHGNMETYEEFVTMSFKELRMLIINRLANFHSRLSNHAAGVDTRGYWASEVQMEALLMCPASWNQEAQSIMMAAATDAGFKNVGIVYESLVAVASELHRLRENNNIREGDVVVVLDIGRGTLDISTATIEPLTRILRLVGDRSTCGLAGSQLINDFVWEYVQSCPEVLQLGGNIHDVCQRMGHSVGEFQMLVSDGVEMCKRDFPNGMDYQLTIRARAGHGHLPFILVDIPYNKMAEFFDRMVAEIIRILDDHLQQHRSGSVHGAIATGGGARNPYVREKLDEYFEKHIGRRCFDAQQQHPICHGGLQHYTENHAQTLPEGVLYICRGEEWDRDLHPDAFYGSGKIRRSNISQEGSKIRSRLEWVEDRLTPVMSKREGERPVGKRVVMVFNVPESHPGRIKFPLFHSRDSSKEHQAAYDDRGKPQKDLVKWTVRFANLSGDFSQHRFPVRTINGQPHRVITGIIWIEGDETHLDLALRVINETDLQYDAHGRPRADVEYEPLIERRMEVWDRYRSYFPMKDEAVSGLGVDPATATTLAGPSSSPPGIPSHLRPGPNSPVSNSDAMDIDSMNGNESQADSGVSMSGEEPAPFLSARSGTTTKDHDYEPTESSSKARKRKRARISLAQEQTSMERMTDTETDSDGSDLLGLFGEPKRRKKKMKKVVCRRVERQPSAPSRERRFARQVVHERDDNVDDNITAKHRWRKPRTRSAEDRRLSNDAREGLEMATQFLSEFQSPYDGRLWSS